MYKIKRMTTGKHNKYLAYNLSNILELFIIILAVPIKLNLVLVLAQWDIHSTDTIGLVEPMSNDTFILPILLV